MEQPMLIRPRATRAHVRFVTLALAGALALTVGCGTVPGDGTENDASADAGTETDTTKTVDTGPSHADVAAVDAAACPGALGCACKQDNECASGVCTVAKGAAEGICVSACGLDCDDKNACTVDLCVAATSVDAKASCSHTNGPDGEICTDGTLCTKGDTCLAGACEGNAVDCDDGSDCTVDWCHPAEGCKHDERKGGCDDGDACTIGDTCVSGGCAPGKPQDCEDGNPCTTNTCDAATGCKKADADGASCSDGNTCTAGDTCKVGACEPGKQLVCDDDNPCTKDGCVAGDGPKSGCAHKGVKGAPCDDGSACTVGDACQVAKDGKASCVSGAAQPCDDGNPCTTDTCDAKTGCSSTPLKAGAPCDDGNACTVADACTNGGCKGGKPLNCDDGKACTKDSCDLQMGCVIINSDGSKCIPANNSCTVGGVCAKGACKPVAQVGCDDGNPCTTDTCNNNAGSCVFTPVKDGTGCNDGLPCTGADACKAGACNGVAIKCDDNNVCTVDSCDGLKGCVYKPLSNTGCSDGSVCTTGDRCEKGICKAGKVQECGDNNACTDDSCDPKKGCINANNKAPCDDSNPCTENDACGGGSCKGGPAKKCDDGNGCTVDICNAGLSGEKPGCQFLANKGAGCTDNNVCTQGDTCQPGKDGKPQCIPGPIQVCDDQNVCTDDWCDPKKGCQAKPNTASCTDNDVCTVGDACKVTACVPGPYQNCDDENVCTVDTCDPKTGCKHAFAPSKCDDGNACTVGDACNNGKCLAGKAQLCNDGNACTDDTCATDKGCVHKANASPCSDGNACSLGDGCAKGACVAGKGIKNCDDFDVCSYDVCYPDSGCKHLANTASCDDGNKCTVDDTCKGLKCVAGPAVNCDDSNLCTNDICEPKLGCTHKKNNSKPFSALVDDGSTNSGKWKFAASTGAVRFTHSGSGWYQLSGAHNATHTMTLQAKVDLSCAFDPVFYFVDRFYRGYHRIDVSSDNGKNWTTLLIRNNESDYIWRRRAVSLDGYKGKTILLRFQSVMHSTAYWWHIRDIEVKERDPLPKIVPWGAKLGCSNIRTEGIAWSCNVDGTGYQLNYKGLNQSPNPNGYNSVALYNVRLDISKVPAPWLSFEERRYYGELRVDARIAGGDWKQVFYRADNTDYSWRKRHVDLSDFKTKLVEVRLRVRRTNSNSNYWGDLRNIQFGSKPVPPTPIKFGAGLTKCADWMLDNAVWKCDPAATTWVLRAQSDAPGAKTANSYSHYATFKRAINLAGAKKPVLRFSHRFYRGYNYIQASADGLNWTTLKQTPSGPGHHDYVWRSETIDLDQFGGAKMWLRFRATPYYTNMWWELRNVRIVEKPKPYPSAAFTTPKHSCGDWTWEGTSWRCDKDTKAYQFKYQGITTQPNTNNYWQALTYKKTLDLSKTKSPALKLWLRHYYGDIRFEARKGDGSGEWELLWSIPHRVDPIWRPLVIPLGAFKKTGVVLRIQAKPRHQSYWAEFKGIEFIDVKPPGSDKPKLVGSCAGWVFEGKSWSCNSAGKPWELRYAGTNESVNTNSYEHHATTKTRVDLAGLKNPVLQFTDRHYYGDLQVLVSTDATNWVKVYSHPNSRHEVERWQEVSLAQWKGDKVWIRATAKPHHPSYWGELDDIKVTEYVAPKVAKPGDPISPADMRMEGDWAYNSAHKHYITGKLYTSQDKSLIFKKVYDLSGAKRPVISFEHAWEYGYGHLDVSTDGKSWTTIWYRKFHGYYQRVPEPTFIDLSSYVGIKALRIRFRYRGSHSSVSSWTIANLSLAEYVAPKAVAAPLSLTDAHFRLTGLWTYNGAHKKWLLNNPQTSQSSHLSNAYHWLWSKVAFNLTALKNPTLKFRQLNSGTTRHVDVSVDGGETWQRAADVQHPNHNIIWRWVSVDLTPWRASKRALIRLTVRPDSATRWWQVRDLSIAERAKQVVVKAGYTAKKNDWNLETGWNWNDGLDLLERKQYAIGQYTRAQVTKAWDLSGAKAPKLEFEERYQSSTRAIYISVDGLAWERVFNQGGSQTTWKKRSIDLAKFKGTKSLYVRLEAYIGSISYFWRVRNLKVVNQ